MSGGLIACLWLWTSMAGLAAAATSDQLQSTPYQRALDCFNHEEYSRALNLLEQALAADKKDAHARADVFNLKGAIYLRQHRFDAARTAFNEAARADPAFWAARFNAGEVSFREKRYAESHRQFDELLKQTDSSQHVSERHFVEYKLLLAGLLDGSEKPAIDFIAEHRDDQTPPVAWYYLNAALDYRHGRTAQGEAWLQRVDTHDAPASARVFAESFAALGWSAHGVGAERAATHDRSQDVSAAQTPDTVAKAAPARMDKRPAAPGSKTLAVVELIPAQDRSPAAHVAVQEDAGATAPHPAFHVDGAPAAALPASSDMPPSETGMNPPPVDETSGPVRSASPLADVMARKKSRASASPSPSDSPSDSPAASASGSASPSASPDDAATPTPTPAPSGTPSPAFIQKYEAAMVQFLQKNYSEAKTLLDEADAIQPNQPNSVSLRSQLFKQYYEAAYTAYQHTDYVAALTQLDGADSVNSNVQNQSDAYNLRGLVLSKQKKYVEAETMFHKAVQTDPGLWAAKFNYAEVPFNYRNFTVARSRFEELFSQTDPVKQPVEAELTQFKVFLTLLLEGKEDAARTFMQHFNFSGATPARYFCQAALNFYTGDVDKAQGWIDSARKEYPSRKSSSFLEAFYRVGWLTDPNAPATGVPSTSVAVASPSVAPTVAPAPALPAVTPPAQTAAKPLTAAATPVLAASPAVALSTPPVPAVASSSPAAVPPFRTAVTPPAVALASPSAAPATPTPTPRLVAQAPVATIAPTPVASPVAKASVAPSASPVAKASATPAASPIAKASVAPTAFPVAKASAAPVPAVVAISPRPATPALVAKIPTATPAPVQVQAPAAQPVSTGGDLARLLLVGLVALYALYVVARIVLSAMNPKPKRKSAGGTSSYGNQKAAKVDRVEAPR